MKKIIFSLSLIFLCINVFSQKIDKNYKPSHFIGGNASSVGGVGLSYMYSTFRNDISITSILPFVSQGDIQFFNAGLSIAPHIRELNNGYIYTSVNGSVWYTGDIATTGGVILGFAIVDNQEFFKLKFGMGYGAYNLEKSYALTLAGEFGLYLNINGKKNKKGSDTIK